VATRPDAPASRTRARDAITAPRPRRVDLSPNAPSSRPAASASTDRLWGTTTTRTTTPVSLPISKGATQILDRATFEKLARRDDVPGAIGAREVKFLMTGVDGPNPQVYFVNTNNYVYHYDFATKALGMGMPLEQFNAQTYFKDARKNLAGTIIAHDNFEAGGKKGMYAMEFWPTDPVGAKHVGIAYAAIAKAMPFAKGQIAYHPAGETQEALFAKDKAKLTQLGVKSVSTTNLFKNVSYSPLNLGEGYGMLRVIEPGGRPPNVRDVVIFKSLPNDLSHVGGVISEAPQTPLSHINLKAKQNDTPNAFIKDASTDPKIAPFIGKLVHYKVTADGFEIEEATQAQAEAWLEGVRPTKAQKPPRDLTVTKIASLDQMGFGSVKAYGAKASNLAELKKILPGNTGKGQQAVPFSFYDKFMKANGLYEEATRMMADPAFKADPAVREKKLQAFQQKIERATIPPELAAQLEAAQKKFAPGQAIRARSSTNNEDLKGFNGAGLYDSYTHRPDEGHLGNTVKQVWASLWNYRAFEEREFHRIDHMSAAMAVLLTDNFDDENANGVAVTKNVYDPNWPGFYVNVQVGESLVTNPDPNATPDEMLISAIGEHGEYETQYIRHSSETTGGKTVLTKQQVKDLTAAMDKIQKHFKELYGANADPKFAMDIEFKIDAAGKLMVKQARPWVD
jgi:pyruvate, water dikinase